jgi:poly(A) polymerase
MSTLSIEIEPEKIDADADKVVRRLQRHGYEAYLVGGCVRDLLLGCSPKDFDVATSATPNEVRGLFRNSRVIGRRFRLVHIFFGPKIIETATFRQNPKPETNDAGADSGSDANVDTNIDTSTNTDAENDALLIRRDNVWGTAQDDALRRDFTLNGLFYDPVKCEVIDFVEGLGDLANRTIATIGAPDLRFLEDPVRILRAIKFAARLDLTIEPRTLEALKEHVDRIMACAHARVLEEIYRLLREGASARAMTLLEETGVRAVLFPELDEVAADPDRWDRLMTRLATLDSLSRETALNQPLTNPVLIGALYFDTLLDSRQLFGPGVDGPGELVAGLRHVLAEWVPSRRDRDRTRQILMAQRRLRPLDHQGDSKKKRNRRRPMALASQEYFHEALTLHRLLCQTGEADASTLDKWETLAASIPPPTSDGGQRRRGRRSHRRRRPPRHGGKDR